MTGMTAVAPAEMKIGKIRIRPTTLTALGAGFFVIDRILKQAALGLTGSLGWSGLAEFTLFRNTGIAFSLPLPTAVFWPLAVGVLAVIAWFFVRSLTGRRDPVLASMLSLVILGAVSNMIDRGFYGATIDYLLFFGISAINLADVMIVGGVAGLLTRSRRPENASSR